MRLYDKMLNIANECYEQVIQEAIVKTKMELNNLTKEQMCFVYSSYLYNNLKEKHVVAKLMNTLDLNYDYEHYFILVPTNDDDYLLDLTYSQFFLEEDQVLTKLYCDGYQKINLEQYDYYLKKVTGDKNNIKKRK